MNCFWLLFPMLLVAQSCPLMTTGSPLDDPMECSPPGSSVHGVLQARILECVAISFSRGSSQPRDWTWVSRIAGRRFIVWATRERFQFSSVIQSCLTLCDPMNCSMPGLPVHHQLPEFTQTHAHRVHQCHPAISSFVIPFSSCPQSLPTSESFPMSQLFT